MKEIKIDTTNVGMAVSAAEVAVLQPEVAMALSHLHNGTGAGNDFIGWVDLPTRTPEELIDDIMATAQDMRERCDTVVCIGIGGSYLGAKAVIHALSPAFPQPGENSTEVVFAGNNISEDYLYELHHRNIQEWYYHRACHSLPPAARTIGKGCRTRRRFASHHCHHRCQTRCIAPTRHSGRL